MGQAAGGNVWTTFQVPALNKAGYEAITFDNRGIPPSDAPPGDYSLADLVADTAGLIEALDAGPCRLVGTSMGAFIATELAVSRSVPAGISAIWNGRTRSTRRSSNFLTNTDLDYHVTNIWRSPRVPIPVRHVSEFKSSTSCNCGKRLTSAASSVVSCRNASGAPRQRCTPWPNVRCADGEPSSATSSARLKADGSRLEAMMETATGCPGWMTAPPTQTRSVAMRGKVI
jgi:alpha/beta hydrolase fold